MTVEEAITSPVIPPDKLAPVDHPTRDSAPEPEPPTPSRARGHDRRTGRVFDWMFRNRRKGRVTVAQFPNVSLWTFFLTVVVRWVVPTGSDARTAIDWIGVGALVWWALDEVFRGVNPWRRRLGLGGCMFVAAGLVSLLR